MQAVAAVVAAAAVAREAWRKGLRAEIDWETCLEAATLTLQRPLGLEASWPCRRLLASGECVWRRAEPVLNFKQRRGQIGISSLNLIHNST